MTGRITMEIPASLKWLENEERGRQWLSALPDLVSELIRKWDLKPGTPFRNAHVSYAVPVKSSAGDAVLKVQWPHDEAEHEAEALRVWNGDGAVRLLAHDAGRHALLLERCRPGTSLSVAHHVDPVAVLTGLLPRLWKPAGPPFRPLREEAGRWAASLVANWTGAGRPCERSLIDLTADILDRLPNDQGEQVLVHQDLHGDNILASQREAWLAIDPKPLAGEREFSLAPIIRSFEFGHSRAEIFDRLDRLSDNLALDRERVRQWAIAQTMCWSFDSAYADYHYATARWLAEA